MKNCIIASIIYLLSIVCFDSVKSNAGNKFKGQPRTLKILSYNVRNCVGLDNIKDYDRVAAVIKRIDADVIAIQELDSATSRSKGVVVLNELAAKTNMYQSYSGSIGFQGGKYGIGILTREKPISYYKLSLPGKEERRSILLVELKDIVICCTHLSLNVEDRLSSIELINEATGKFSKPVFLAGDQIPRLVLKS